MAKESSIEKAQKASVEARKVKAARIQDYKDAVRRYNREHITLPLNPSGTPEQEAKLSDLWRRFIAIQDRIKGCHTARGRAKSQSRRETLMDDLLACNEERAEIEASLRALRRKMAGPAVCAQVDIRHPSPPDFGLKPEDVS